jgi:hypothetical protein
MKDYLPLVLLFFAATIFITGIVGACPTPPHYVRILILDDGIDECGSSVHFNQQGAQVTAIQDDHQGFEWLYFMGLFQEPPGKFIVENQTGITNGWGFVELPLYQAVRYNISVTTASGKKGFFRIYPSDNDYIFYMGHGMGRR